MKNYDVIIVGAGVSGLTLAHYCAKAGQQVLVLEKTNRAGGCFHSHRFEGAADGFWIEMGAHACYNSYGDLIGVLEDNNLMGTITPRAKVPMKFYVGGKIESLMSQISLIEMAFSVPKMFSAKKEGTSVEDYYSTIIGKNNYKNAFGPMFDAVISQTAAGFPADSIFKKRPRNKSVLGNFTFSKGLSTVTDALAGRGGVALLTGQEVTEFSYDGSSFKVVANGETYESKYASLAVPPPAAAKLLQASFPDIASEVSKVRVGCVESVGFAIKKDKIAVSPFAFIIAINEAFYSIVSRDTVPHDDYRGFAFHFKPGQLNRQQKIEKITSVLGIKQEDMEQVVAKDDNCVPSLVLGHEKVLAAIDAKLAGKPLMMAGNFYSGVAIEDCVSRSKTECERVAAKK
ncbi:MAG TPA: FAD-dependent oxidoreductase [Nitrospirota bacterium]|jgi:protoporphyrinogen oxidase